MTVVDSDSELIDTDFQEEFVDDQGGFDIGHDAGGADGVEIALDELAESTVLRVFAPPDRGDVIAFEGCA